MFNRYTFKLNYLVKMLLIITCIFVVGTSISSVCQSNENHYQLSEIVAYDDPDTDQDDPGEGETPDDETTDGSEMVLKYTVEEIIFNKVPILDINFFTNTAAGYTIEENSPLAIIRTIIATWYVTFRNVRIATIRYISNV